MRAIVIGLIAAVMAAVVFPATALAASAKAPQVDAQARSKGMAAAPGVIKSTGIDCDLADARLLGTSTDAKTKVSSNYYELACKNAEGYIVGVPTKAGPPPQIYTCLEVAATPKSGVACILPGNADPKQGLAALVAKDAPGCQLTAARGIGHTVDGAVTEFEVACAGGAGYIVDASFPLSISKPARFNPCVAYSPPKCTLTDAAASDAYFNSLISKMGKPCQLKDKRYVGVAADGSEFYEVACQNGKGYMLQVAANGQVSPGIDCAVAENIAGGCTLTNSREAQTEQAGLYTTLAQKAGFACNVSKYGPIDANVPGHEVVELACSNRPDGAIAIFPADASQPGRIYDCAHSELAGYRCGFTQPSAAFPRLTNDLKALGKTSCVVSGERVVGTSEATHLGYLEVACADGNPGYIISYNLPQMTPKEALTCSFAKGINGGCQMPENQRRG